MLTLMMAEIIFIFYFFAYQTVYKKFLVLYRFYEFLYFFSIYFLFFLQDYYLLIKTTETESIDAYIYVMYSYQ